MKKIIDDGEEIFLFDLGLTDLPDLSDVKLVGSFFCSRNSLTSLSGSPHTVTGEFFCYDNQLDSLRGAPKKIGGDFLCESNPLTSLDGIPKKIDGDFVMGAEHVLTFTEKYIRSLSKIKGEVLYQDEDGQNYEEWEINGEESPDDRDWDEDWEWDRDR